MFLPLSDYRKKMTAGTNQNYQKLKLHYNTVFLFVSVID